MMTTLVRYCMAAGFFMSVANTTVDQTMDNLNDVMNRAKAAVEQSQRQQVKSAEVLRPSEMEAIGNYLETPTLDEVYPGLRQLTSNH